MRARVSVCTLILVFCVCMCVCLFVCFQWAVIFRTHKVFIRSLASFPAFYLFFLHHPLPLPLTPCCAHHDRDLWRSENPFFFFLLLF